MRALSIHANHGQNIAEGVKLLEIRGGPLPESPECRKDVVLVATVKRVPGRPDLPYGQALCVVDLPLWRPVTKHDAPAAGFDVTEGIAWVVTNVRPIRRFRVAAKQCLFWRLPSDIKVEVTGPAVVQRRYAACAWCGGLGARTGCPQCGAR